MSVTVSGPFTIGPTSSPSSTSSHQRGSAPRGRSRAYCASISSICVVGVRRELDRRRTSCARGPSSRSVRIISRYWPDSSVPVVVAEHLRGPLVDRPARRTRSACRARRRARCAGDTRRTGTQRRPPLARARRRRRRARRAAGRPSSGRGARRDLGRPRPRRSACRRRPAPAARSAPSQRVFAPYVGIAPQRVVVAVGARRRCGTCRRSARGSAAACGCGSGTPMRARRRATPSSVIVPGRRRSLLGLLGLARMLPSRLAPARARRSYRIYDLGRMRRGTA